MGLKIVGCILVLLVIIFAISVYQFGRPLRRARAVAKKYKSELRREASQLLSDARSSATVEHVLPASKVPRYISYLNPKQVRVSPATGMVIVQLRGGFVHEGLVLADDLSSFSANALPTGHRQLSPQIWEYND
jgi:hypothetical protein